MIDADPKKSSSPGKRKAVVQVIDLFSGCGGMSFGFGSAETWSARSFRAVGG